MKIKGKRLPRGSRTAAEPPASAQKPAEVPGFAVAPGALVPFRPPPVVGPASEGTDRIGHEALTAFAESQAAASRGLEAISDEIAGMARVGIDIAAHTATEMLAIKTMSDAYRVNARFLRQSFDGLLDGSSKLSRLGVKLAAESARPLLTELGERWILAVRLAF